MLAIKEATIAMVVPRSNKKNPDWIDWAASESKYIIMKDLEDGNLSLIETEVPADLAWKRYRGHPKFVLEAVCFGQFKQRLRDHRMQVMKRATRVSREVAALAHDRLLYPRQAHNHRGEPVFDCSTAKQLLREDVRDENHVGMTPLAFQQTSPAYMVFKPDIIKGHIHQEVRRQKYCNFLEKEQKKEEQQRKKKAANAKAQRDADKAAATTATNTNTGDGRKRQRSMRMS